MRSGSKNTALAKDLRKNQTDAEGALWARLRQRQLAGVKFRRQQTIGQYIVDFVTFEQRVVVEVDGGHHGEALVEATDNERTAWLEGQGFKVLRFWNSEVLQNPEGVLEAILEALK